ncbi:integrase [Streptomyces sp. NBC_01361]|uniref:integrase n=1 Tax=Streptomyces sp. NBC_01361 TaxID=2903838 RepID=UPI002E35C356|nr:integrase [Streptomyces sp. NBC_01361]
MGADCRRELLDRTLIWNQRHLLHTLREFEHFYNGHRPHPGIANARPLPAARCPLPAARCPLPAARCPLPATIADPEKIARLDIRRRRRLGGILHEYHHDA